MEVRKESPSFSSSGLLVSDAVGWHSGVLLFLPQAVGDDGINAARRD